MLPFEARRLGIVTKQAVAIIRHTQKTEARLLSKGRRVVGAILFMDYLHQAGSRRTNQSRLPPARDGREFPG
jgi:hypothetical protein